MAIENSNLQLLQSERLTDNDDGGGMMTGTPLSDGDINNLWDDVDSTELARGGVSIRRFFPAVRSSNTDKLLGARCAIMKDADAENISTLLFQTGDHYAVRSEVQDEIESYVVVGTRSALRPVGTQRADQNALILYADKATDQPEISQILVLEASDGERQFVKITDVDVSYESYAYVFDNEYKTYRAWQFVCSISQPLGQDFEGSDPTPTAEHATTILTTQSSNSAVYYGVAPLAEAVTAGNTAIVLESVQSQLIPVATTEVALVDQTPGVEMQSVQPSGAAQTVSLGNVSGSVVRTLPVAWVPGSLTITVGTSIYKDSGDELQLMSGTSKLDSASVSPAAGRVELELSSSASVTLTFTPGVAVNLPPWTKSISITDFNRQLTYTGSLSPVPAPGALRVEYLYNSEWYELTDDGSGTLSGNGSGTVNYNTGSYSVVLPNEPDSGSDIILTWAAEIYEALDEGNIGAPALFLPLDGTPETGTLTVDWSRGSTSYNLTQASDGSWSGNGAAEVIDGGILLMPAALPDSAVTVAGNTIPDGSNVSFANVVAETSTTVTLASQANILPVAFFSVQMSVETVNTVNGVEYASREQFTQSFYSGTGDVIKTIVNGNPITVGALDRTTGVVTFDPALITRRVSQWSSSNGYVTKETIIQAGRVDAQTINLVVRPDSTVMASFSNDLALADITVRLDFGTSLMPGAQWLTIGSQQLNDSDGVVYRNWSTSTAAGVQVGVVNYSEGLMELDYSLMQPYINNLALALKAGAERTSSVVPVTELVFRTAAAPIRPSGMTLQARRVSDGALITVESDTDGVMSGTFDNTDTVTSITVPGTDYQFEIIPEATAGGTASGDITYATGVTKIEFRHPVFLSTISYSAVSYSTISLDPKRIGLDPVKLPASGQVMIYKTGGLVLIHHTEEIEEAAPTAGQVIDCSRTELAVVRITDAAGTALDPDQYSVDLEAGTVTFADPFTAQDADANSLTMPLTISHRIQDLCATASVRIDGNMGLMTQLTHDYPAGSLCSSVMEFGDLQSRVENLFEQKVDSGSVFLDELDGDASVAQYNALAYPIVVDNLSCVQERWKLRFTNTSSFECVGEVRGVIGVGTILENFAPINPFTGLPYFTVRADGFGSGWVTSNVIRFNTVAAAAPVEAIRTTLPSHLRLAEQNVYIEFMGDAD